MDFANMIEPGMKVDIYPLLRDDEDENARYRGKVYKSQVLDLAENGNFVMSMPTDGGKMFLLPLDVRYDFVFYARKCLFRAEGVAVDRYKTENCYMAEIELKTRPEKFQRREYYRYPCLIDITYFTLTDEEVEWGTGEKIFVRLQRMGLAEEKEHFGRILDMSGGGIKIRSAEQIAPGQNILLWIFLKSDTLDKEYHIVGNVVESVRSEDRTEMKFETRIRFLLDSDKTREEIIRYIFEEERKDRNNTGR
jgi:c-di-GMP-binding flagellar brake protein YcgR